MNSEGPEQTITGFIGVLDESGYRGRIKIAYDEWNLRGWYHPGFPRKTVQNYSDPQVVALVDARKENLIPSQYTMADALFTASVNTRGPLHVHPAGIVKRTHFHAMAMYANLLGSRVVDAEVKADSLTYENQSVPVMDAIATRDDADKNWSIALVNRHPVDELICQIVINGETLEGSFDATILSGDSAESYNGIEHPNRVVPAKTQLIFKEGNVTLSPHSLIIVKVPPKG
jgi:alpha-N-arabinofuranosidase